MQSQLVSPSQMWSKSDVVISVAITILKFAEPIYASQALQLMNRFRGDFLILTDQNAQILCARLLDKSSSQQTKQKACYPSIGTGTCLSSMSCCR